MFNAFDLIETSILERSQEKTERKKGFQNNVPSILCKMLVKQMLKKSKSRTNDEIDLCISFIQKLYLLQPLSSVRNWNTLKQF